MFGILHSMLAWWEGRKLGVVKVVELVGHSTKSWEDAAQAAVKEAAKTLRHMRGIEILNMTGDVNEEGEIVNYRADVQIAFAVESDS